MGHRQKTSEDAGHSCGQALCQALAAIAGKDNSQASGNGTDTVSAEVVRQEEKLRETILECIANAALQRVLRKSRFDNSSQLSQFFTLDLGGEWGAFIETAKELAELVFNPETSGAGVDMDRNKELLKSFRIPFLSLAAKPRHCRTEPGNENELYNQEQSIPISVLTSFQFYKASGLAHMPRNRGSG